MEKLLPIGSIVLLKNGQKKVMIYGRKQIQSGTNNLWDYISCLYPEGNIDENHCYLFNHEDIDKLIFIGYQDEEELNYQEFLGELEENEINSSTQRFDIKELQ
jgi:Uncharacterized protein conserved in bacteria